MRSALTAPDSVPSNASNAWRSAMSVGLHHVPSSSLDVVGTLATLHVDNMVFPSKGHYVSETRDGIVRNWTVAGRETYDHQLAAIVDGLASGEKLLTEGEDSVAQMQAIDSIYAAAGFERTR